MKNAAAELLSEVTGNKPISARTREFQHRRLQNRYHRFLLTIFKEQQKKGLTKEELARRIGSTLKQVNIWLSIPSNLSINILADLILGMEQDLDDVKVTSLETLEKEINELGM